MSIRQWRRIGRNVVLGGGLLLGWAGADAVFAQGPVIQNGPGPIVAQQAPVQPTVQRSYFKQKVIQLPIRIEGLVRSSLQEIHLYMKDQPSAPWVLADKAVPAQTEFVFRAPGDGEFWFTMVTIDRQGRSYPADVRNEPPGLAVIIDTQAPQVDLINLGTTPEGQIIQCDVIDPNLDTDQTRVSYQAGDKMFRILDPLPGKGNIYCIPAQAVSTGLVQVNAKDLADNQTTRQEHVSRMKTPKVEPVAAFVPPPPLPELKAPSATTPKQLPMEVIIAPPIGPKDPHEAQRPQQPTVRPNSSRPDGSQGPRWMDETSGPVKTIDPVTQVGMTQPGPSISNDPPSKTPPPAKRQIVNTAKVYLDYQIENAGPGSVAKVEVWLTRDQGQSWQKHSEAPAGKSQIEVALPGDGLYGLTLVAGNGRTPAMPPGAGDQPDGWIEVDTTRPALQVHEIQTTHDKGQATVQIRWTAQDKNLADGPVELLYAATLQGPWLSIAKGLPGAGQHSWTPPPYIGTHVHVQVKARDTAGNETVNITQEPIAIAEPVRPRAIIRTISTNTPPPGQVAAPR